MFNQQAANGHSLGLSVGATNLAGTRDGRTAVVRPAEVTLHGQRLTGFVDRVGDPVPMVAPDGSNHRPESLLAEALGAVSHAATEGMPVSDTTIAVPAHWRPSVVDAVRRTMRDPVPVVSDATAALTALSAGPGLPMRGVIVLCDFGGSGTSITLANASSNNAIVGETVRYSDFSGDHIDQALLTHVVSGLDMSQVDPFGTGMVGSLTALRDECRRGKERLSAQTATAVTVDVAGHRTDVRVTRVELEDLVQQPLAGFLAALDDALERYGVPPASVAAVGTVGGGARIPLVTQRLSEHLRAPVVTTPDPQLTAATGAALLAARSRVVETVTTLAPAAAMAEATEVFDSGPQSATFQALAWSDDDVELPYADAVTDYYQQASDSRPELSFRHEELEDEAPPRRGPLVLFGLSAVAAGLTAAVFGLMQLTGTTSPVEAATTSVAPSPAPAAPVLSPAPPAPQAPLVTTVVVTQRPKPAPRQAPVTVHPPVAPVTAPPTTPPTSEPPPPPQEPPSEPAPPPAPEPPTDPSAPNPPPIDPGPGDGSGTPPTDPAPGEGDTGSTPPIDPGPGNGEPATPDTPPADSGTDGQA